MARYSENKKRPKKVVNKEERKVKDKPKQKNTGSKGFYYSFLTVILFLCLIQIAISAVLNVSKVVSYNAKIVQITKTRDAAKALNEQLKDNINNFSNATGLEAIARNNLKNVLHSPLNNNIQLSLALIQHLYYLILKLYKKILLHIYNNHALLK